MQAKGRWRSSSIRIIDFLKENDKINGQEVISEKVKAEVFSPRIKDKYESSDWNTLKYYAG